VSECSIAGDASVSATFFPANITSLSSLVGPTELKNSPSNSLTTLRHYILETRSPVSCIFNALSMIDPAETKGSFIPDAVPIWQCRVATRGVE